MRHFGFYEPVVQRALEDLGSPPWSLEDLHKAESAIGENACREVFPHCTPRDVTDWIRMLSPADQQELVDHLNEEAARKQVGADERPRSG